MITLRGALDFLQQIADQAAQYPDDERYQDISLINRIAETYPELSSKEAIYLTLFEELGLQHPSDLDRRKWRKLAELIDSFRLQ